MQLPCTQLLIFPLPYELAICQVRVQCRKRKQLETAISLCDNTYAKIYANLYNYRSGVAMCMRICLMYYNYLHAIIVIFCFCCCMS